MSYPLLTAGGGDHPLPVKGSRGIRVDRGGGVPGVPFQRFSETAAKGHFRWVPGLWSLSLGHRLPPPPISKPAPVCLVIETSWSLKQYLSDEISGVRFRKNVTAGVLGSAGGVGAAHRAVPTAGSLPHQRQQWRTIAVVWPQASPDINQKGI